MPTENNETNQENTSFNDQNKAFEGLKHASTGTNQDQQKLSKGVTSDEEETDVDTEGETYSQNLMSKAEAQVRETEDASLQDETYSFDESNTDNEEYHDADGGTDFDLDNDDDFVQ